MGALADHLGTWALASASAGGGRAASGRAAERFAAPPMPRISARPSTFGESVIREMTRLAIAHGAINLAQGFPDFEAPDEIKDAACARDRG